MMHARFSTSIAALVTLALLAGCSEDPVGPSETYDARLRASRIDGEGVPYVEVIEGGEKDGCERIHAGGHVILHASGTFEVVLNTWYDLCDGVMSGGGSHGLGTGSYRLSGGKLILETDFAEVTAEFDRGERLDEVTARPPSVELEWSGTTYRYVGADPLER